jgi:2-polyprenyl-6-methoxyphenol hydroxylase-like FAD-dependent oxidoreductase
MSNRNSDHAIVLGGGMAGLLTARVLAETYSQVTVVDRDELAVGSQPRRGAPQGRHVHALLARGQQVLEQLFPGLTAELVERGAPIGDALGDVRLLFGGHRLARAEAGLVAVSASRPLLEDRIRARVRSLTGVGFGPPADAVGLRLSPDRRRVTGVRLLRRADGSAEEALHADLVVNATGRGSRAQAWLEALGFDPPAEQRVRVDVGYATRRYRLPTDALDGDLACVHGPPPDQPRGGALARLEGDVWMLTLCGFLGDHPPTNVDGFDAFARSLRFPDIHDALRAGEPIDDPARFRFPANVKRRYERTRHLPEGFLVLGDAMCSFNPIYGQGMTVAALEAIALRRCLADGDQRLASRFFRAASRVADHAWNMATGSDLALPGVDGPRNLPVRLANAYIGRVLAVAAHDPAVAASFARVAGMVETLPTLLHPALALRILRPRTQPSDSTGWHLDQANQQPGTTSAPSVPSTWNVP